MKTQPTLKQRLTWLALLLALVATLLTPVVTRQLTASNSEPDKVAVNWNSRVAGPTPTPKP